MQDAEFGNPHALLLGSDNFIVSTGAMECLASLSISGHLILIVRNECVDLQDTGPFSDEALDVHKIPSCKSMTQSHSTTYPLKIVENTPCLYQCEVLLKELFPNCGMHLTCQFYLFYFIWNPQFYLPTLFYARVVLLSY